MAAQHRSSNGTSTDIDAQLALRFEEPATLTRLLEQERALRIKEHGNLSQLLEQEQARRMKEHGNLSQLLEQERARRMAAESRIKALTGSTSWRVTGPLRGASQALRKVLGRA